MSSLKSGGTSRKMRRVAFWASAISILLLIEVFSLLDFAHRRQAALREAQLLSELTATRISMALSRNDVPAAIQIMKRLNGEPRVIAACLYGPNGRVLGHFVSRGFRGPFVAPSIRPEGNYRAVGVVNSFQSIRSGRQTLGTLYMEFNASGFFESWEPLARFGVMLLLLCLAAAVVLSRRLQRTIAGPILDWTRTALRVASEKQYRNLFDRVPDPVFIVDRESLRFLYANETASRVYGYSNEELLKMTPYDLHEPNDRHRVDANFDDDTAAARFNTLHVTRDGRRMDVEVLSSGIIYEDRRAQLSIARDVTMRNQIQQEMKRAQSAAEEASQAKSAFLANMSHEIRTPMNGILGMIDLALDTPLSGEQREYITLAKSSAESLLALINDILDFSKIEAGKLEFENVAFPLRDDLGGKIKSLGHLASRKGIELIWRVRPDVPDWVVGDPGRLRQILYNLVGNAIKFTREGQVLVDIWREEDLPDGIRLHFLVRDTGIGIPAGQQARIFDAFTQADSSTTRKFGGTGLGLAVVKGLVERMDGRIWVESEAGKGSSFHFTARFGLPAADFSFPVEDHPAVIEGLRVLVADDNSESRLILAEMLKHWRMEPAEAENCTAAFEALARARAAGRPFQLAVIDAELPADGGPDLMAWMRKNTDFPSSQVVLLGSLGSAERWRKAGAGAFLSKPVQQSELWDAIVKISSGESPSSLDSPFEQEIPATGKRVLLAEDNALNQRLAARVLEKMGFSVTTANDGGEVLDLFSRMRFDAILMDVQMPAVDGLKATRTIRETERTTGGHVPIVILTAHAMKGDRERCLAAGADDYLAKPIVPAQLASALKRFIFNDAPSEIANSEFGAEVEQPFHYDALLDRLEGDRALLAEMVHLFDAEAPELMGQARADLDRQDFPALQRTAHTLAGAIGNFGGGPALRAAQRLEEAARQNSPARAATALQHLQEHLKRLIESLEPVRTGILK